MSLIRLYIHLLSQQPIQYQKKKQKAHPTKDHVLSFSPNGAVAVVVSPDISSAPGAAWPPPAPRGVAVLGNGSTQCGILSWCFFAWKYRSEQTPLVLFFEKGVVPSARQHHFHVCLIKRKSSLSAERRSNVSHIGKNVRVVSAPAYFGWTPQSFSLDNFEKLLWLNQVIQ